MELRADLPFFPEHNRGRFEADGAHEILKALEIERVDENHHASSIYNRLPSFHHA
jgi:hypothetical protein